MRRKEREVKAFDKIIEIIKKCDCLSLALIDGAYPYIVPLNFGFSYEGEQITFYFHGADAGKKMEIIRQNPHAAFEMNCSKELVTDQQSCEYSMNYQSVCGYGDISIIEGEEKVTALNALMRQYAPNKINTYSPEMLNKVAVYQLQVKGITAKQRI